MQEYRKAVFEMHNPSPPLSLKLLLNFPFRPSSKQKINKKQNIIPELPPIQKADVDWLSCFFTMLDITRYSRTITGIGNTINRKPHTYFHA